MKHYLIDTHAHLYDEAFDKDRRDIVFNAHKAGIKKILMPNIDSTTIDGMLALCKKYPQNIFPMMGLHPTSVEDDFENELEIVKQWLDKEKFVAIGEIGLDLYWDKTFFEEQIKALEFQIDLAIEHQLPVVIHCRDAFDEIFEVFDRKFKPGLKGVFHSFTGDLLQANKIINDYGFSLGINGIVTFKKSNLTDVLSNIDLKHIIIETDAPYLAPEPKRGQRNESSYMFYTARKIADIYGKDIQGISEATTNNVYELFNLNRYEQ
ncbi:MAG: TatD family hydrolase [Bacteroidales bacterium]|nr:TatD family hydrolase [Bacteroidales bacterium]